MTEQTRALVPQPQRELTLSTWEMLAAVGEAVYKARTFGVSSPQEASIKMLPAYEHAIPLSSALSTVYIIENKPTLAPKLLWAKVIANPDFGGYEERRLVDKQGNFHGWEITLKRKSGLRATRRFTLDDARRIIASERTGKKLAEKSNWQNYPEQSCYWRTLGFVIDVVFSDVAQGIYTADALGAEVSPEGDIITGDWAVEEPTSSPPPSPTEPEVTLDALLERFGAEAILEANEGKIPATEEECVAVLSKLEAGNAAG